MAKTDAVTINETAVRKRRRFDTRDFNLMAEQISDELRRRQQNRQHVESQWKEIDRQISMEPDKGSKLDQHGRIDPNRAWLPEMELPLQAQTLEVLTADARRLLEPDSGSWFAAHSALTDKYLDRVDFEALIAGDENEVPSAINQDNADKLVQGVLDTWQRQYDFWGHVDGINAEAFKYGTGVGRARLVTKRVFLSTARGVLSESVKMPMLVPNSIWHTYPDDTKHKLANEGEFLGGSDISCRTQRFEDVVIAASKGSNDPDDENGGWMPKALKGLHGDKDGLVQTIEYEGDLVIPRKTTRSLVLPGVVVTALRATSEKSSVVKVIRFRFLKRPYLSRIYFPYHTENLTEAYAASPLLKGMPIQKTATELLNLLIASAALNVFPPVGYDKDDREFAIAGGPIIEPHALWGTVGDVKVHQLSNPAVLLQAYVSLLNQYADVTGVSAPRLGAQTVSHTTAFAKQAELTRGASRTVDYVRSMLAGPLLQWLDKAYDMGRDAMTGTNTIFIEAYSGFAEIKKQHLPDLVSFDAAGAGGPSDEQDKAQVRLNAMTTALQMDAANVQLGGEQKIDMARAIEQVLRQGGWTDLQAIVRAGGAGAGPTDGPALGAITGSLAETQDSVLEALTG